mgnify:CR=1 FL=1
MAFPTFSDIVSAGMVRRDLAPEQKAAENIVLLGEMSTITGLQMAIDMGLRASGDPWKEWTARLNALIADLAPIFPSPCPAATECANLLLTLRMQGNQAILSAQKGQDNDKYASVGSWRGDAERTMRTLRLRAVRYIATGA